MWKWQDFHRDWHRWTSAERLSAVLLGVLLAVCLPASILFWFETTTFLQG